VVCGCDFDAGFESVMGAGLCSHVKVGLGWQGVLQSGALRGMMDYVCRLSVHCMIIYWLGLKQYCKRNALARLVVPSKLVRMPL